MVRTDLPADWNTIDIRGPIPGNSFSWGPENEEPLAAKKRIVIHATAAQAPNEDGFTMGAYHIGPPDNWPGIGVMWVVTKDAYVGHAYDGGDCPEISWVAGTTPSGAHVQYVGDVATIRAGVYDMNPGSLHIEISGLFTPGNGVPSEAQLRAVRHLIDKIIEKNNVFPSINFYNQVTYHNAIATPGNGTECPGWQHPQFAEWFGYLQGGAEPSWWSVAPVVDPPVPTPVIDITPPVPAIPEWESTYRQDPSKRAITREGAFGIDVTTGTVTVPTIAVGTEIDVAGYFETAGVLYARTVYSEANNKWNGLNTSFLEPITGQPSGDVPVTIVDTPPPSPPDAVQTNVSDAELAAATVPLIPKMTFVEWIKEVFAKVLAGLIKKGSK